jgi:CRP-like cAMP-binding protein
VLRGKEVGSRRLRSEADQIALDRRRDAIVVVELQGELGFAAAERTHRTVEEHLAGAEIVVLDLTRVAAADRPARDVLDALVAQLAADGVAVATIDAGRLELAPGERATDFDDGEAALEWSEDRLLDPAVHVHEVGEPPVLADFDLLAGVAADDLAAIDAALVVREYDAGKTIFHQGDVADSIHLLLAGQVRVMLPANGDPGRRDRTVAVFGPGVAFGELALLGDANRTADVVCERPSTVGVLALAELDRIGVDRPMLRPTLLVNLGRLLARRLQGANAQLRALAP